MHERLVHDPCHGDISLDKLSWHVIDTPQFQRLRYRAVTTNNFSKKGGPKLAGSWSIIILNDFLGVLHSISCCSEIKQLGSAYFVYPGASHNRFEHSIGVAHLAGEMIDRIRTTQPELDVSQDEVLAVRLAGLCHDLGHGPFSHVFDNCVIPQILGSESRWTHEVGSKMMFRHLIEDNHIDISTDQVRLISSLIDGIPYTSSERRFLYQVVANKKTSLDVDKFDYIVRDTMNVGLKSSYDSSRLTKNFCVIGGDIAYHAKEAWNIYELFHTRYSLHKRIYTHKTCTAIDLMISDAMVAANPVLRIDQAIYDPEQYLWLNDGFVRDIERHANADGDALLTHAQSLIHRIRTRNLYRCVDECVIEYKNAKFIKERLGPEHIVASAGQSSGLGVEDIRVSYTTLDFGMKDKDPVSNIYFYGKHEPGSKFYLKSGSDTSQLVPRQFVEVVVRVYATNPSIDLEYVQGIFRKCIEPLLRECGSESKPSQATCIPSTPVKRRRGLGE